MNIVIRIAGIFLLVLFVSSCFRCKYDINYEYGEIPGSPVNFEAVNTEYDDYNSSVPAYIDLSFPLVFSTNRYTSGEEYDLINYVCWMSFDQTTGDFTMNATQTYTFYTAYYYLADLANSEEDEFGPINYNFGSDQNIFCFASNRTDRNNMEIYVCYWDQSTFNGLSPYEPEPFRLVGVNSPSYDAYPSFSSSLSKMIFSSNRDGELDFYTIDLPDEDQLDSWIKLEDTTFVSTPVAELNSPAKDVCPYIIGNLIVFASDREGGYGGYDLWYAEITADGFGEPVNFGSDINTEHNEFRPVVMVSQSYSNDLMIFSSDRPGGSGGYDLYYVGVERMTVID